MRHGSFSLPTCNPDRVRPATPVKVLSVLVGVLVCISSCTGSHFRYGTVSYQQLGGNTVTFLIESRWRRSFSSKSVFAGSGEDGRAITGDVVDIPGVEVSDQGVAGPVVFHSGDGAVYPLTLHVTAHSVVEDFLHGYSRVEHTYVSANNGGNDWIAALKGCCREYGVELASFDVQCRVNVAFDVESLLAKGLPLQRLPANSGVQQVFMAASSPTGGLGLAWRIGEGTEVGGAEMPSANAVYFPQDGPSGYLFVNTDILAVGIHPVVVQIGFFRSVTPYDFALEIVPEELSSHVPFFDGNPIVSSNITGEAPPVLSGYVGYEIYFTIAARTMRQERKVAAIRAFSLPPGGQLLGDRTSGFAGNHRREVDFRWTPLPSQAREHLVCVDAVDDAVEGADVLSSLQHCVKLEVVAENPAPEWDSPPDNATIRFFLAVPNSFIVNGTNNNPYDNLLLFPKEPLLDGQALSPPVATEKKVKATDPATRVSAASVLTWTPAVTLGAYNQAVCFVLSQQGGPGTVPRSKQRCVTLTVERCKYIAQAGDTIQHVGELFNSDWLSLWALNVNLRSLQPAPGAQLLIGRLYAVQRGDTLESIASEFGTTVEGIRRLNFDLRSAESARELPSASEICIFPDTCTE